MKPHEMRELTIDELKIHHRTLVDELVNLRIKLAMRQLDNGVQVKHLKRKVARTNTILREKQMGAVPGEKLAASK